MIKEKKAPKNKYTTSIGEQNVEWTSIHIGRFSFAFFDDADTEKRHLDIHPHKHTERKREREKKKRRLEQRKKKMKFTIQFYIELAIDSVKMMFSSIVD